MKHTKRDIDRTIVHSRTLLEEMRMISEARLRFFHVLLIVLFVAGFVSAVTWTLSADYFSKVLAAEYHVEE